MPHPKLVVLLLLLLLVTICDGDPDSSCPKTSPLVNLESEFKMVQHQLRGSIKILDDCSFQVSNFDMLPGSDVHWWGALAADLDNLTAGFLVSDQKLNDTFKRATFTVRLRDDVSWDRIPVLAVWDLPTSSDFGHILLRDLINNRSSDMAPSPSPSQSQSRSHSHSEPTMLDNCKSLSDSFRVRWNVRPDENVIDVALEAATGITNFMAFGWASPQQATDQFMLGADVAVAGFDQDGIPFVNDFYISKYSECTTAQDGSVKGVCPDAMYPSNGITMVNNTNLVYGHRRDAVSFIRYQRPLESADHEYDVVVNRTQNMVVIWAVGPIRPPDSLQPYYLPQYHGGPEDVAYGYLNLNVSENVNDCYGPIDAQDKEDQHLIIADAKAPLVVTSGQALRYPDPPYPSKVLYINKKEAPVLRVERGVPVTFSIQAGHDVALYITSDPLGGNATLRNASETIYAGGSEYQGVQASPKELVWAPDRNTPNLVYYQSLYDQKMGYKVQVVDGGLPDMYNNSVVLDDQQVTLFWTLAHDSISIAVRGEKKSGFLAIGFGSRMVNSYAYVGWIDNVGKGRVNTYWIDGNVASSVHPTYENLTYVRCMSENGIITFEFTRPLKPSCGKSEKPECRNIIDPTTPLKLIWAMGSKWSDDHLSDKNMHFVTSSRPIRVLLMRGSAEAEQDLQPVLTVHGFMMFLAWAILLPGGVLAARYLKHVTGDGWYRIHVYLQYSGLAIVLLALLFAVAELRGFYFGSLHVKLGTMAILLVCMQPVNAYFRPKKPNNGEQVSSKRLMWEYLHVIGGRSAIVVGFGALVTGLQHLGDRYGGENVGRLTWALIVWLLIGALIVVFLEYYERQRREIAGRSNWVLGNLEEDDSVDLLSPNGIHSEKESHGAGRMEVQLEPLNR